MLGPSALATFNMKQRMMGGSTPFGLDTPSSLPSGTFVNQFDMGMPPRIDQEPDPVAPTTTSTSPEQPQARTEFDPLDNPAARRRALLALGSGLLGGENFFQGLSQGIAGYQGVLDQETAKYRPQLTKDSTFSYYTDPVTGKPVFEETPVAGFERDNLRMKLTTSENNARYGADMRFKSSIYGIDSREEIARMQDETERWKTKILDATKRYDTDTSVRIAQINNEAQRVVAEMRQGGAPPAGVERLVSDLRTSATAAESQMRVVAPVIQALENGSLKLGIVNNTINAAKQATGIGSDEQSRLYGQLRQATQGLANALLLVNKGVQTDGDALRAMIESYISKGDAAGAARELRNAYAKVQAGYEEQMAQVNEISSRQGMTSSSSQAARSGASGSMRQKYGLQ